jgi:hypothetical protein
VIRMLKGAPAPARRGFFDRELALHQRLSEYPNPSVESSILLLAIASSFRVLACRLDRPGRSPMAFLLTDAPLGS